MMDHTYASQRSLTARLLVFATLAIVGAVFASAAPDPAPATGPHGININHKFKVETIGLTCDVCHTPAEKNPKLMAFPTMDTCSACHADDTDMSKGTDACVKCHSNPDYSSTVRKDLVIMPAINFDHRVHTAAKVDCLACHKILDKVGVKGDEMLPDMATCQTCHIAKKVKNGNDCATCHNDDKAGVLKPASHTALWIQTHGKGITQKTIDTSCQLCHTPANGNDCATCHQREAPPTHTGGWALQAHGRAALTNSTSCSTCHSQSQCLDCHTEQKPFTHTTNWLHFGHPRAAQSNLASCAVCHTPSGANLSCQSCHSPTSATAVAPNSHIPVWNSLTNTHCSTCHVQPATDLAMTSLPAYTANDLTSNCSYCHKSSPAASHTSVARRSAANGGDNAHSSSTASCLLCHAAPPHNVPAGTTNANCASCHPYQI